MTDPRRNDTIDEQRIADEVLGHTFLLASIQPLALAESSRYRD